MKDGKKMNMCEKCREYYRKYSAYKRKQSHHKVKRNNRNTCLNPQKAVIERWIYQSRQYDKKHNIYYPYKLIDEEFLKGLIEDRPQCYFDDCQVELKYVYLQDDTATLERLDRYIGHTKSNCILCCKRCKFNRKFNLSKQSQADPECQEG